MFNHSRPLPRGWEEPPEPDLARLDLECRDPCPELVQLVLGLSVRAFDRQMCQDLGALGMDRLLAGIGAQAPVA